MKDYNRNAAIEYAESWALSRNPKFANFSDMGGDCANFASQCIHAGGCPMNFNGDNGWFYNDLSNRSPSWSGTEFLHTFLVRERSSRGPVAVHAAATDMLLGDIIQLSFDGEVFSHNLVIVGMNSQTFFVASHTNDVFNRALYTYYCERARYLHILGYKE